MKSVLKTLGAVVLAAALNTGCEKEWVCEGDYEAVEIEDSEDMWDLIENSEKPIAVAFHYRICPHCPDLVEKFQSLAPDLGCRVDMYTFDIWTQDEADLYHTFNPESGTPATACFHKGELKFLFVGNVNKEYLETKLRKCAEFGDFYE